MTRALALATVLAACHADKPSTVAAPPVTSPSPATTATIALPGAPADGLFLDYLAYDAAHHRVWVPAGGTGKVDVIDATTRALTPIDGFPVKEVERRGKKRTVGPSSATVGDNVVYIGNRGDSTVCAVDATTLAKGACATLAGSPDGLQYIAKTHEVWVTTPRDKSIVVLDASKPGALVEKSKIAFEGEPEGFAVDEAHGLFFTNLEDKDRTLVVDVATHAIAHTWQPDCGEDGPKGLIFDAPTQHLVVVCPEHLTVLDAAHDGAVLGSLAIGAGLDAVGYAPARHELVAAAAGTAMLVVARLEPDGKLTPTAAVPTVRGARNAVNSDDGTAFVAVGPTGSILVVPPQPSGAAVTIPPPCPAAVTDAVAREFPGSKVAACRPEREDGHDQFEAKLVDKGGESVEVDVSPAGAILQTERDIPLTALPAPVTAALAKRYPGIKPTKSARIATPGKPEQFEVALESGKEATFAADGTFVEEE